jgi:hypothetical protein
VVAAAETRDEAYERAGRRIIDESDVVVALWNGGPSGGRGGTAEIVEYARDRGVPVVWLHTEAPFAITDESGRTPELRAAGARQRSYWIPPDRARFPHLPLEAFADWIIPEYARADLAAVKAQRWYDYLSLSVFTLPVIATLVVAWQVVYEPRHPHFVIIEVIALVTVLVIVLFNRMRGFHGTWITNRFLAERLRSSYFMAVSGKVESENPPGEVEYLIDPEEAHIVASIEEVRSQRPKVVVDKRYYAEARAYLAEFWIDDQADYHRRTSAKLLRWDRVFWLLTTCLFGVALAVAIAHVVWGHGDRSGEPRKWYDSLLIALAIGIPVVAAGFHGYRSHKEYKRHAERYRWADLLDKLKQPMTAATDLESVQDVAAQVESLAREENNDWFGAARLSDIELIA